MVNEWQVKFNWEQLWLGVVTRKIKFNWEQLWLDVVTHWQPINFLEKGWEQSTMALQAWPSKFKLYIYKRKETINLYLNISSFEVFKAMKNCANCHLFRTIKVCCGSHIRLFTACSYNQWFVVVYVVNIHILKVYFAVLLKFNLKKRFTKSTDVSNRMFCQFVKNTHVYIKLVPASMRVGYMGISIFKCCNMFYTNVLLRKIF